MYVANINRGNASATFAATEATPRIVVGQTDRVFIGTTEIRNEYLVQHKVKPTNPFIKFEHSDDSLSLGPNRISEALLIEPSVCTQAGSLVVDVSLRDEHNVNISSVEENTQLTINCVPDISVAIRRDGTTNAVSLDNRSNQDFKATFTAAPGITLDGEASASVNLCAGCTPSIKTDACASANLRLPLGTLDIYQGSKRVDSRALYCPLAPQRMDAGRTRTLMLDPANKLWAWGESFNNGVVPTRNWPAPAQLQRCLLQVCL